LCITCSRFCHNRMHLMLKRIATKEEEEEEEEER
jgi:hypothetical protein